MPTMTTKAGPWNMTVFSFAEDEPDNPLAHITADEISRFPFGAAELDRDGKVISYTDTEPEGGDGPRALAGRDFFTEVARWAGQSMVADEFRKGVASGELNAVFDFAAARLHYKVRVHLKVSPILGTFWVFVKKLKRS